MQIMEIPNMMTTQLILCLEYPLLDDGILQGPELLPRLDKVGKATIYPVAKVIGRAHIVDIGEFWAVNTRIDLHTFNHVPVG